MQTETANKGLEVSFSKLTFRFEQIMKHSLQRRKELQDFLAAINKRIDLENYYSRQIQYISTLMDKHMKQNMPGFIYSAFKSSHSHRSEQTKILIQSLKQEVFSILNQVMINQNAICKKIINDGKQWNKELNVKVKNFEKVKMKYSVSKKEEQEQFSYYQLLKSLKNSSEDVKSKNKLKTTQLFQEKKMNQKLYLQSTKEYNQFLVVYEKQMYKIMVELEKQEIQRIEKQKDSIMKTLVFQTSMNRNLEYDIESISKQMQEIDPHKEIENLVNQQLKKQVDISKQPTFEDSKSMESFLDKVINKINNNIIIKEYYQDVLQCYKNSKQMNEKLFCLINESPQINNNSILKKVVCQLWHNIPLEFQKDLEDVLDDDVIRREMVNLCRYKLKHGQVELNQAQYDSMVKLNRIIFQSCLKNKDCYCGRRLLESIFIYYKTKPKIINSVVKDNSEERIDEAKEHKDKEKQNVQQGQQQQIKSPKMIKKQNQNQMQLKKSKNKIYLYLALIQSVPLWKYSEFWQASIFESLYQEFNSKTTEKESQQDSLQRDSNIKISQLANFCNLMINLSIPNKQVRIMVGKFCIYLIMSAEQNKNLSKTITRIHKDFKEMIEEGLIRGMNMNQLDLIYRLQQLKVQNLMIKIAN